MMREEEKQERFRSHLLRWYAQEGRRLPWREHITPYRTWVSEIMLQQTRVEAVISYFERFITTFPSLRDLAEADDDLLHKMWEGLGYYSRVRNMKKCAQVCVERHDGELPHTRDALLELPGIGGFGRKAGKKKQHTNPHLSVICFCKRFLCRKKKKSMSLLPACL